MRGPTTSIRRRTKPSSISPPSTTQSDAPAAKPVHVDVGEGVSCALLEDGTIWCWGKLDNVVDGERRPPTRMNLPLAPTVAVGSDGCLITRDDGIVCGWLGLGPYVVTGVAEPLEIPVEDHGPLPRRTSR